MYLQYLRQRIPLRTSILQWAKINKGVSGTGFKAEHRVCFKRNVSCKVSDEYPLTKTEAVTYVEEVLDIPDCQTLLAEDPLSFINTLSVQTKARIPFTNISFFTREGVYLPDLDESKELMLSRQGGNCSIINVFTEAVLRQLGLQTYLAPSSTFRFGGPRMISHSAIIIKDLVRSGTFHLVDPGTRLPIFKAVSLEFKESSPVQIEHGIHFKYIRASLGAIQGCRKTNLAELEKLRSPALFYFNDGDFWSEMFTYNINESMSPSSSAEVQRNISTDPTGQVLHEELLLVGFPEGEMVDINSKRCLITSRSGNTIRTSITNSDDLLKLVEQFFPCVSSAALNSSLEYFGRCPK